MGVGVGGGGFGVRGGIKASSTGIGAGVGVGPFSATGGCGLSSIAWLIGVVVVLTLAIYLLPILIAVAAGYFLILAARDFRGGRDASLLVFGLTLTADHGALGGAGYLAVGRHHRQLAPQREGSRNLRHDGGSG